MVPDTLGWLTGIIHGFCDSGSVFQEIDVDEEYKLSYACNITPI